MPKLNNKRKTNKHISRKMRKNKRSSKHNSYNKVSQRGGVNEVIAIVHDKPLSRLVDVTLQACHIMAPMIKKFYNAMNDNLSTLKDDQSVFTIADGIVQYLLSDILFKDKFKAIVGEEKAIVNIVNEPFTVISDNNTITVPDIFNEVITKTKTELENLSTDFQVKITEYNIENGRNTNFKNYTVFIDPIDGTREFATGKGEQSTICIGFSDNEGNPNAGVVYRPIPKNPTWAIGCASEVYYRCKLDMATSPQLNGFLTSNGSISPFLVNLIKNLNYSRVPSGGAGNKMLMLLEKKGGVYIQDRGLSRWDTCAAQAVLEASGGRLVKLYDMKSYTYLKSEINRDFEPGVSLLTAYNSITTLKKNEIKKATDNKQVTPYANLLGVFAVAAFNNTDPSLTLLSNAINTVSETTQPSYD